MSAIDDFSPADSAMTIGKLRAWGQVHSKEYGDGKNNTVAGADLVATPGKVATLEAAMDGKADLVDGKVPVEQLPEGVGGSGGAVDSVNGKTGDVVLRLDDFEDIGEALDKKADASALDGYATTAALTEALAAKADASALTNYATVDALTATNNTVAAKAALASPALTGTPTAPTAAAGNNSTQIATTAFVARAVQLDTVDNGAAATLAVSLDSPDVITCTPGPALTITVTDSGTVAKIVAVAIVPTAACALTVSFSGTVVWVGGETLSSIAAGTFAYLTLQTVMNRCIVNVVLPE